MKIDIEEEVDSMAQRLESVFDRMFRRVDSIFNQAFGEVDRISSSSSSSSGRRSGAVRVLKSKESVRVEVDLPGVRPEDVDVSVESGQMIVTWKREHEGGGSDGGNHVFSISRNADVPSITAKMVHGVLSLIVPVVATPPGETRKVKVNPG